MYVATRVRGLPTASSFLFEGCKDPGSALSSLAQAVRAAPAPIAYTDEQAVEETKNRGKKSAVAEKPKQLPADGLLGAEEAVDGDPDGLGVSEGVSAEW